jgi:hypothetical protein
VGSAESAAAASTLNGPEQSDADEEEAEREECRADPCGRQALTTS